MHARGARGHGHKKERARGLTLSRVLPRALSCYVVLFVFVLRPERCSVPGYSFLWLSVAGTFSCRVIGAISHPTFGGLCRWVTTR